MGKIVLLVPREEMLYQAHNILQEKKYAIAEMKVVQSDSVIVEARQAIASGATILIARGLQASMIKQYTDVPVVEIVLTSQEMGLLITRARQILKTSRPVIAVIGRRNMFCDMSYFDEIYDIELRTYYETQETDLVALTRQAVSEGAELIIGGDVSVEEASRLGKPSLFLSSTEDSLKNAFETAESMEYAMNVEKKSAAQIETLLDFSYNGVIRIDGQGRIIGMNPQMCGMLDMTEEEGQGKLLSEIARGVEETTLERVLREGKEASAFLEFAGLTVFAMLAPVLVDGQVDSVIISCQKITRRHQTAPAADRRKRGLPALTRLEDIRQKSHRMQECIHLARLYAMSDQPVVIMGDPGTEKKMLAQGIHNISRFRGGPFLDLSCDGLTDEEQREMIFGERGAVLQAQGGSLLLQDVDSLTASNQYRLYQLIRFRECHTQNVAGFRKIDIRIMITLRISLHRLMESGILRKDLYYLLSGLEIAIPALRERPEDLKEELEQAIRESCDKYSRYHVLTEGAGKELLAYAWPGNLFQIDSFCERLILTTERRNIDEIDVRNLLSAMYAQEDPRTGRLTGTENEQVPSENENEAGTAGETEEKIRSLLVRYDGSREKTAAALGISKTTLWRYMKRYGIRPGKGN